MGTWRPKHAEWPCRNKTCTVLHQVGVSFDLYCDSRKHKIKICQRTFKKLLVKGRRGCIRRALNGEKRLAADNVIGWPTLAVEEESGTSEVVCGCGHQKQEFYKFWTEVTIVFHLLEYDFYLNQ